MASAPGPPPPVIGKSGNLTVFITPPSPGPDSPGSEFSTPPTSPRPEDSPESPTSSREANSPDLPTSPHGADSPDPPTPEQPAATPTQVRTASLRSLPDDTVSTPPHVRTSSPPPLPLPGGTFSTPPLVRTVSPPVPPTKIAQPAPLPPVQVPPPQYDKASTVKDGSVLTLFWDAVARVQEAHASLDEYISNWFGLDQSKYQWALNDYYERNGQEIDSVKGGNPKELPC